MMNDDLTSPEQINRQSFMEEEKNEEKESFETGAYMKGIVDLF